MDNLMLYAMMNNMSGMRTNNAFAKLFMMRMAMNNIQMLQGSLSGVTNPQTSYEDYYKNMYPGLELKKSPEELAEQKDLAAMQTFFRGNGFKIVHIGKVYYAQKKQSINGEMQQIMLQSETLDDLQEQIIEFINEHPEPKKVEEPTDERVVVKKKPVQKDDDETVVADESPVQETPVQRTPTGGRRRQPAVKTGWAKQSWDKGGAIAGSKLATVNNVDDIINLMKQYGGYSIEANNNNLQKLRKDIIARNRACFDDNGNVRKKNGQPNRDLLLNIEVPYVYALQSQYNWNAKAPNGWDKAGNSQTYKTVLSGAISGQGGSQGALDAIVNRLYIYYGLDGELHKRDGNGKIVIDSSIKNKIKKDLANYNPTLFDENRNLKSGYNIDDLKYPDEATFRQYFGLPAQKPPRTNTNSSFLGRQKSVATVFLAGAYLSLRKIF